MMHSSDTPGNVIIERLDKDGWFSHTNNAFVNIVPLVTSPLIVTLKALFFRDATPFKNWDIYGMFEIKESIENLWDRVEVKKN